jgi:hypothetical protein
MQLEIIVKKDKVYGNEVIRPVCNNAYKFCALVNQKTLTPHSIELIKSLGYTIKLESNPSFI